MKLFQRLKIWKELKRLERRLQETPSPSTFVDLGQVYINLGQVDQTVRVSEDGLRLFPDSEELHKLHRFATRSRLNQQIRDLRSRLNKSPSPKSYKDLAGLYLELGDMGAVHGVVEECIRRFPNDAGAHLILAKAHLGTFYRDLSARDGYSGVQGLMKVVALEPGNAKAHRMLAEVLYRIGAVSQAIHHLEVLRDLTPGDRECEGLLREALEQANTGDDIDGLFHRVEASGRLIHAQTRRDVQPTRVASDEALGPIRNSLAQLVEMAGVRKAAYIKGSKALVKGEIRDGKDGFLRVVRIMSKAAQRVSRRMDIGNFSKGVVDGDFGHICLCSFGDVLAAVLCDSGAQVDRILAELQEMVAGSLYASGRKA